MSFGSVAIVLHAHLPWVRHPEHERSFEERWFYEALWESYIPLLERIDRLAAEGVDLPLTLSFSPPLLAMLRDELLLSRFDTHLASLESFALRERARLAREPGYEALADFYPSRLAQVRRTWDRIGGDLIGALAAHDRAGRIELFTTTATHAYLPGLLPSRAAVRAQIRLGPAAFERYVGFRPRGLWLPECAYDPRFAADLGVAGVGYTIVDAHGLEFAVPCPATGTLAPVLGQSGVAFFGRDPEATHEVWSREVGYPSDSLYREFYRDAGFELPTAWLGDAIGPNGLRWMTGLKYHRITHRGDDKAPYEPERARKRAREHAEHFVARRSETLQQAVHAPAIVVAPYDAELFGHWWFEGPDFLEEVCRVLHASAQRGGPSATTLSAYLERAGKLVCCEPAASSWGHGGYGEVWVGPNTAPLWRHIHHAEREVRAAIGARRNATGVVGEALDQAIRELLLLQASDFPFMLDRGEMVEYAERRIAEHLRAARRLAAVAASGTASPEDARYVRAACRARPFLRELEGGSLRAAFD